MPRKEFLPLRSSLLRTARNYLDIRMATIFQKELLKERKGRMASEEVP